MRNEGYFWVKYNGEWIIAYWERFWWLSSYYNDNNFDDSDFDEIDENQITRKDKTTLKGPDRANN